MRKTLLTTALAISATLCMSAAPFKVTVTPLGEKPADSMLKAPSVSKADVIVSEDFSGFTEGETLDVNKWGEQMCSHYRSEEIDPSLTHGAQWTGHNVHQAGGCAGLFDINVQDPAYINTPKMDYSGSVTITFLAKSLLTEWEEEDENGEPKKWHFSSTTIMMRMANDNHDKFQYGSDDTVNSAGNFDSFPIYPNQGWCEIKIEFDNYSAYNDAFFQIASAGHLLVDDLRITTSVDKFIAEPVFKGFTGATENGFTITFESVRKAFNYYTYLYEQNGQDENGNPIYKTVINMDNIFSPEDLEAISNMGMTVEEYMEFMAQELDITLDELWEMLASEKPYNNFGKVEHKEGTNLYSYTYYNLDPTKQYYYDIRAHYYLTFSPENIRPVEVVGTPQNLDATDISETGFTANWSKITQCDGYTVDLYGVNVVEEDEDNFVIFEEDFDATEELTDATDIANPDATGEGSDITFDDLTSSPGWVFGDDNYILLVKGKAGLGVDEYGCFRLTSPTMYVAGADMATLSLSVESTIEDYEIRIRFAGQVYSLPVKGNKFEGEFELPTFGLKETNFAISGPDDAPIFIDYISVSQPLHKGDMTFTWLGREETDKETLSHTYTDLDSERFGRYAFSANAFRGEDDKRMSSFDGERMIVDLKNGSSSSQFSEVEEVMAAEEVVEVARYTLDGQRVDRPVKGINIIRYSDGSVRKVMVK
jgi:hypothetical protein